MLINISRASNIDEAALLDALESKTLGFACLDVFDGEPDVDPRFIALDNVLLQPHHASGTIETRKARWASSFMTTLQPSLTRNLCQLRYFEVVAEDTSLS